MRSFCGVLVAAVTLVVSAGCTVKSKPLRVCMISGSWEYKSEESLPKFKKYLEESYNVRCTIL